MGGTKSLGCKDLLLAPITMPRWCNLLPAGFTFPNWASDPQAPNCIQMLNFHPAALLAQRGSINRAPVRLGRHANHQSQPENSQPTPNDRKPWLQPTTSQPGIFHIEARRFCSAA
eukprot:EG_transcript_30217